MLRLSILLFVCCGVYQSTGQLLPKWPTAYVAKCTLRVPYAEIREPFDAWYDNSAGSSRVDYQNGTVKTYQLSTVGKYGTYFKIEPVLNTTRCFRIEGTAEKKVLPQYILPDMTGFTFKGEEAIDGVQAEKWELVSQSGKVSTMYFYWKIEDSTKVVVPLRYEVLDKDHHILDFHQFLAIHPPSSIFEIEDVGSCKSMDESEFDGIEEQLVYSFNPIQEYVSNVTEHVDLAWENYKKQYNKHYDQDEDSQRKEIFRQQMRYITSTNRANLSYTLGVNHLVDYTAEELEKLQSCVFENGNFGGDDLLEEPDNDNETAVEGSLPPTWDWRIRGAVTPVKDQSRCGSCWSFSATGAIEGAHFIKTKRLVTLSEQALVDCTWGFGNRGCNGGTMEQAFRWVIKNKIPLAREYGPYLALPNYCHVKSKMSSVRIKSYKHVKKLCPKCLKQALIKYGPVSVSIHVGKPFTLYRRGVYSDPQCAKKKINHAVLIVGYGKFQGKEYWLVKNSWSNKWGVGGYILMDIKDNTCGIMKYPVFVKV